MDSSSLNSPELQRFLEVIYLSLIPDSIFVVVVILRM